MRRRYKEILVGYLFASPWIIGFIVFIAGPMIASVVLSFTDWNLLSSPKWIGFKNYYVLLKEDNLVFHSLKVTTYYAFTSVPLRVIIGLMLAILLNQNIKLRSFFRTVYYLPSISSGVAVSILWLWLLNSEFGLINYILRLVGINGPNWLGDSRYVIPAFVLISLWGVGGSMLIYLAGLQDIPTEYYEAAEIDGANSLQRFWYILLPLMSPIIFFNLITGLIAALQIFTQAFIITGGGPHNSSLFFVLYLYRQAFTFLRMGYASALAWILFLYIFILTLLIIRSSNVWVFYSRH
ncbi:MAG: sugar ABC transporter permease [Saccharolobus sp.]